MARSFVVVFFSLPLFFFYNFRLSVLKLRVIWRSPVLR